METPAHVILRCPNGHDLRVATTDIGKPLSCPLCNTVFQTGGGPSPPPVTLGYAGGTFGQRVTKPAYTNWLLGLWLAVTCISVGANYSGNAGLAMSCLVSVVVLAAAVLQLMWIYRIHQDAAHARGYRDVAPGTALGLSFIPYFNYIWTGWTLKKLAEFAAKLEGHSASDETPAVRAGRICFIFGIVQVVIGVLGFFLGGAIALDAMNKAGSQSMVSPTDFDPFANAGPGFWVLLTLISVASLITVIVYVWAVKRIEAALYQALARDANEGSNPMIES